MREIFLISQPLVDMVVLTQPFILNKKLFRKRSMEFLINVFKYVYLRAISELEVIYNTLSIIINMNTWISTRLTTVWHEHRRKIMQRNYKPEKKYLDYNLNVIFYAMVLLVVNWHLSE